MDVTGVKAPAGLQGRDLLDPAAIEPRDLFSESFPCPVLHTPDCPGGCVMRSVVSWPNKFIWSSKGSPESYDLQQDPNENHNLFGSLNPIARALSDQLRAWIKTMPPQEKQHLNLSPDRDQALQGTGIYPVTERCRGGFRLRSPAFTAAHLLRLVSGGTPGTLE